MSVMTDDHHRLTVEPALQPGVPPPRRMSSVRAVKPGVRKISFNPSTIVSLILVIGDRLQISQSLNGVSKGRHQLLHGYKGHVNIHNVKSLTPVNSQIQRSMSTPQV